MSTVKSHFVNLMLRQAEEELGGREAVKELLSLQGVSDWLCDIYCSIHLMSDIFSSDDGH
jgi:3-methyladenine DNA glycosylase/8-oxoguanine DNA glycosylase